MDFVQQAYSMTHKDMYDEKEIGSFCIINKGKDMYDEKEIGSFCIINKGKSSPQRSKQLKENTYSRSIYKFLRSNEKLLGICPTYMNNQPHIDEKMRQSIIDWLTGVHEKFSLVPETLYLTTYLMDLYLASEEVTVEKLQLVGITCFFIATKYEEIEPPSLKNLVHICDHAYSKNEILDLEKLILKTVNYSIAIPTSYVFLKHFLWISSADKKMEHLSCYILDGTLHCYELLRYLPSQLAAASILIARKLLGKTSWSSTLAECTNYKKKKISLVACVVLEQKAHISKELITLEKKYSVDKYSNVSDQFFNNK